MLRGLLALWLGAVSVTAFADDNFSYYGYMRSGMGWSQGGTDQSCFKTKGVGDVGKFRLGNECDTYIEFGLRHRKPLHESAQAPAFMTNLTLAATSLAHRDWEATTAELSSDNSIAQDFTMALREAYVQGTNVLGSASPWVGKRFYRRLDFHMLDYYLLANTGPGAGIENIPAGFGRLHLAVTHNVPNPDGNDGPAQTNLDTRLSDLDVGLGSLEVVWIHAASGKRGHSSGDDLWEPMTGDQLALIHFYDVLGGFNRFVFQYGKGLFGAHGGWHGSLLGQYGAWASQNVAKDDADTKDAITASSTIQLADQIVYQPTPWLSGAAVLVYKVMDFGGYENDQGEALDKKSVFALGVRPTYHFSDQLALALEVGQTQVTQARQDEDKEWVDATMQKVTLAPEVTAAKGYWARPVLRVFATYAKWDEGSKEAKDYGSQVYADATSGFSTGVQLETWW